MVLDDSVRRSHIHYHYQYLIPSTHHPPRRCFYCDFVGLESVVLLLEFDYTVPYYSAVVNFVIIVMIKW